ncbi:MAG: hypothetical protein NTX05_02160 [Fusobacteria bacterium]|nr:hypothetical protein [Fusobacteriota bacterium]
MGFLLKKSPRIFIGILIAVYFYMPTLELTNSIAYSLLKTKIFDIVKSFPPLRVFRTIGFIAAIWSAALFNLEESTGMFYLGGIAEIILGVYSLIFPKCSHFPKESVSNECTEKIGTQGIFYNCFILDV